MRYFLPLLLLFFTLPLSGQEDDGPHVPFIYTNFNLQLGFPLDDFQDRVDATGLGFGGYAAVQLFRAPVFVGYDFAYQQLDYEELAFTEEIDGQLIDFELRTRSNLMAHHLLVRYQPAVRFPLWPYFDVLLGAKHLYTRTKLVELLGDGEENILESERDLSDWPLSYGGAFGLQYPVLKDQSLMVDLRFVYLPGANARYYARRPDTDGIPIQDSLDFFEQRASNTPVFSLQLGVTIELVTAFRDMSEPEEY